MRRWIMHVDMDAFFASVEQRDNPEWKRKPVIVGGKTSRSVVATASYEARKFGVHSAMPIAEALKLCPDGIYVKPRMDVYRKVSEEIHKIMYNYAAEIEPLSMDEAFMDISGMNKQYPTLNAIGDAIRNEIKEKLHLTASVGIAPNKFLAKIASDMNKPDGLTIIPYGKEKETIAPLPVRALWGVGRVTEKTLLKQGYKIIGDIQKENYDRFCKKMGNIGKNLYLLAQGVDNREVTAEQAPKSIGDETTYAYDIFEKEDIERKLIIHCDIVAQRLREKKMSARTITLRVRFESFKTITRSMSQEEGLNLTDEIYKICKLLLSRIKITEKIRLLGVYASNLTPQMHMKSLFDDKREKKEKAAKAVDEIRKKFGKNAIQRAIHLEEKIREIKRKEEEEKKNGKQSKNEGNIL